MGSRLAMTEKRPTKSRGLGSVFFGFFDWNRMLSRRKKKLFSNNKLLLPSVSKKFGGDEKMPKSKHFLIADEELEDFPISQKQNGLNNQMRDPGPVARLMGLESMPIVQHKKPSNPSLMSEFGSNRYETSEAKDSRPQKLQRTGGFMERQHQPVGSPEASQSNRRGRRQHHHKLASPVKSPRLLSKRSTARLMNAATKILEPGLQSRRNPAKCALTFMDSSQSDDKVTKDGLVMKRCRFSLNDSVVGSSTSFSNLNETMEIAARDEETLVKEDSHEENKMKPLDNRTSSPFSQAKIDSQRSLVIPINKERPTSLDVRAKINAESRARGLYEKKNCVQDEYNRKILRQNQLPTVKGKFPFGPKMHDTQLNRRDLIASDSSLSSCTRSRRFIKELGRERVEIKRNRLERENKVPKRRPNDESQSENGRVVRFTFEKPQTERSDLINRKGKGIVSNHSINCSSVKSEFKNPLEGNDARGFKGNDIVSFTFSSPMRHACRSFSNEEKADKRRWTGKSNRNASHPKRLASTDKIHSMASQRDEILRGDSLSALLEQKIEELNSLDCDEVETGDALEERSTASILGDLILALRPSRDHSCSGSTNISDHTISYGEMVKANERSQAEPEAGISSAYLVNGDHPSPMSVLDVSFSNDSCFSGSPHGSSGYKPVFGSTDTCNNTQSLDLDTDLLDSASSFDIKKFDMEKTPDSLGKISIFKDIINLHEVWFSESKLSYSTEAKSNAKLVVENISLPKSNGQDSFMFDTLEEITSALAAADTKDGNQFRRLVIDCIIECLDSQCNFLFKSGSNLSLAMRRERLTRVVCKEIEGWNGLVGKAMDDIVENDMSHSNGMWPKFEIEAFSTGLQIENYILDELVDVMVIDLCI